MTRRSTFLPLLSAAALVVAACADGGPDRPPAEAQARDSAGVRIVENRIPPGGIATYGTLGTEPSWSWSAAAAQGPFGGRVQIRGAATLADGTVAVAEAGTFRVRLLREGEEERVVGGPGVGPGRFQAVTAMGRGPGEELWVTDSVAGAVTLVRPDADEGQEATLPVQGTVEGRFGDGSFLVRGLPAATEARATAGEVRRPTVAYLRWRPAAGTADTVLTSPGLERLTLDTASAGTLTLPAPLARDTRVAVGPGRLYLGDQERFEIRGLDPDGMVRQLVRLDGLDLTVTPELLADFQLTDPEGREPSWAEAYWSHVPETRPAFGRLLLDAMGHLWVAEHVITGEPARTWLVFDAEGTLKGQVTVPAGLRLTEVGTGHVLGVRELPGQPPRLERYRLDREAG